MPPHQIRCRCEKSRQLTVSFLSPTSTPINTMQGVHMAVPGLSRPQLTDNSQVTGATTDSWRKENKKRRLERQFSQPDESQYWREHTGLTNLPGKFQRNNPISHKNKMCPSGLALRHPAGPTLLRYDTQGRPTHSGQSWTRDMMQACSG